MPRCPAGATPGAATSKQRDVVKAFKWAWKGYKEHAWGKDELLPVSQRHSEWFKLGEAWLPVSCSGRRVRTPAPGAPQSTSLAGTARRNARATPFV